MFGSFSFKLCLPVWGTSLTQCLLQRLRHICMQNHVVHLCKEPFLISQVASIGTVNTIPVCLSDASSIFRYSMHSFISSTFVWEAPLLCYFIFVCSAAAVPLICHMHIVSSDLRLPSGGIVFQKISFYQGLFHMAYFHISCVMVIVIDLYYGMCCNL